MKITLILLSVLFYTLIFKANAQMNNDTFIQHLDAKQEYDQLLKKSHNQKTTATVLGIAGGAICLTGVILAVSSLNGLFDPNAKHHYYGNAPDVLGYGGAALMVAAIPFALAARKNKTKAMLYIKNENVIILPGIKKAQLASVGIRINL
ncbi:MAG: hypothetical protein ACRDE5_00725 [Ginsengibacter sp.]